MAMEVDVPAVPSTPGRPIPCAPRRPGAGRHWILGPEPAIAAGSIGHQKKGSIGHQKKGGRPPSQHDPWADYLSGDPWDGNDDVLRECQEEWCEDFLHLQMRNCEVVAKTERLQEVEVDAKTAQTEATPGPATYDISTPAPSIQAPLSRMISAPAGAGGMVAKLQDIHFEGHEMEKPPARRSSLASLSTVSGGSPSLPSSTATSLRPSTACSGDASQVREWQIGSSPQMRGSNPSRCTMSSRGSLYEAVAQTVSPTSSPASDWRSLRSSSVSTTAPGASTSNVSQSGQLTSRPRVENRWLASSFERRQATHTS